MLVSMDSATSAVVWLMERNGFKLTVTQDGETYRATATHPTEGTQTGEGRELLAVVCDLAERFGFELEE